MAAGGSYFVGTAAWKVPKLLIDKFGDDGSHLERYARRLNCTEINSTFYREHRPQTFAKWAACTPSDFRFAVKLSKRFTHIQKLEADPADLEPVVRGYQELGAKLGPILVQLPPSLVFDREVMLVFFESLRLFHSGPIVVEPRHRSWDEPDAHEVMLEHRLTRAVVDPDPCQFNTTSFDLSAELHYYRLHGSPEIYRSRYGPTALQTWEAEVVRSAQRCHEVWCVFDNTTFDHATENALEMRARLEATNTRFGALQI